MLRPKHMPAPDLFTVGTLERFGAELNQGFIWKTFATLLILAFTITTTCQDVTTQTYTFPLSTYSSQPISSNLSTFPITSLSILFIYPCISSTNLGIPADKILTASKAALVLLLIATVATGIPRYSNQGLPKSS